MISKSWQSLRSSSRRRWGLALLALVLIVVVSMVIGIIVNATRSGQSYTYSENASTTGGYAVPPQASGASNVPAPTSSASGSKNSAAPSSGGTTAASSVGSQSTADQSLPPDRLIIRNATVALTADDVEKTLMDVRALATEKSGVVFQSNSTVRADKTYATLTIQVPAAAFDETMNRLRKLTGVKVTSEDTTSQDVTEEYVDIQAQLKNLQATETELVRLLNKAQTVDEILSVQTQLTNIRGQIDQRQGRINYLEKRTAMSSITVNISPVLPASVRTTATGDWNPLAVLEDAWAGSLKGLQGLASVVITLGVWLVWLGPLALVVYFIIRRFFRAKPSRPAPTPTGDTTA
ncbi:MAG: DUF4349 domain-containing protein [Chloroflexi bacterium]|nr:DUF4349 domain-containing protein [Chloroflexota bacterium]OJV94482.1 MAG: hypothetical protein BGO39_22290 [Chloroflexi bacterium 54-19]